eukprot:scaffold1172_cov409-Prasinococcus_capsulatus_cf.AAC.4
MQLNSYFQLLKALYEEGQTLEQEVDFYFEPSDESSLKEIGLGTPYPFYTFTGSLNIVPTSAVMVYGFQTSDNEDLTWLGMERAYIEGTRVSGYYDGYVIALRTGGVDVPLFSYILADEDDTFVMQIPVAFFADGDVTATPTRGVLLVSTLTSDVTGNNLVVYHLYISVPSAHTLKEVEDSGGLLSPILVRSTPDGQTKISFDSNHSVPWSGAGLQSQDSPLQVTCNEGSKVPHWLVCVPSALCVSSQIVLFHIQEQASLADVAPKLLRIWFNAQDMIGREANLYSAAVSGEPAPSTNITTSDGCQCEVPWKYAQTTYTECANPDLDDKGPWCPVVPGSCPGELQLLYDYCNNNPDEHPSVPPPSEMVGEWEGTQTFTNDDPCAIRISIEAGSSYIHRQLKCEGQQTFTHFYTEQVTEYACTDLYSGFYYSLFQGDIFCNRFHREGNIMVVQYHMATDGANCSYIFSNDESLVVTQTVNLVSSSARRADYVCQPHEVPRELEGVWKGVERFFHNGAEMECDATVNITRGTGLVQTSYGQCLDSPEGMTYREFVHAYIPESDEVCTLGEEHSSGAIRAYGGIDLCFRFERTSNKLLLAYSGDYSETSLRKACPTVTEVSEAVVVLDLALASNSPSVEQPEWQCSDPTSPLPLASANDNIHVCVYAGPVANTVVGVAAPDWETEGFTYLATAQLWCDEREDCTGVVLSRGFYMPRTETTELRQSSIGEVAWIKIGTRQSP